MSKTSTILFGSLTIGFIVAASIYGAYRYFKLFDESLSGSETELIVTNTTPTNAKLFRTGDFIGDAKEIIEFDGKRIALSPGDYFLQIDEQGTNLLFPISVREYPRGTEDDGSFSVTVRPLPDERPVSLADSAPFLPVPSGYFLFGDRLNLREPHFVWTQAFFIGKFEVTNSEYRLFLDTPDGFSDASNWSESGKLWKRRNDGSSSALLTVSDANFARFGQADMPVTGVTWFEAAAYGRWLTRKLGNGKWIYSLPTEAEWEKAARGPDGFDYSLSRRLSDTESSFYNWKKNPLAKETVLGVPESVSRFKPNRYGLYHMSGNVVEWTQSIYRPISQEAPYDNDERNRDDSAGARVARGGSWYSASSALLYIAYRDSFQPELFHNDLGFRIVARRIPD